MTKGYIEEFTITNVYQIQNHEKVIVLYFMINDQPYSVRTSNLNGYFEPSALFHESNELCSFCGEKRFHSQCQSLRKLRKRLFHRLIEFSSIRLEWLYLKHEPPINHKKSN